jgi:hypothetical protein
MWGVLRKETAVQKGKTVLRVDVADAMKWLWERDEYGCIPAWTPGTVGPVGGCLSEDVRAAGTTRGCGGCRLPDRGIVGCVWMGVLKKLDEATGCWRSLLQTSSNCDW